MHLHTHNCLVFETFLPVVFLVNRSDLLEFQNIRSAFIHSNLIMAGLTICSSCLSKSVYESTINHALICDTSQRCAVITGTGDLVNRGVAYTDFRARPRVRLFCYVFRMNESDCDCSQLATYTTWSNMAQHILETVRFLTHRP